jgi:glycine cleavage system aminomethyltransferase T
VNKLDDDDFMVVASDTAHGHVRARLQRFADSPVSITDVTADYAQLNVQGPRSRDVLAELTDADLSTEAFGFRSAGWVDLAGVRLLLARITYLGELGYELYVPAADALGVYDAIQSAGAAFGIRPVGLKALASLRMEKAYRDFGHDIDNTDCPLEAGLGFAMALDKPTAFIGRDAVLARKAANAAAGGMARRIVQVRLLDPEPLLFHAEIVLRDGQPVGYVRAASYGWTLGSAVGLAMVEGGREPVTPDWLASGSWEIDVAGTRYPAEVSLRPMYDPTSARVRS